MNKIIKQYINDNLPLTVRVAKEDKDTLIGLPYPYSVSGYDNVFQEMYYWGTYFTNTGLIIHGDIDQAKNNVDNMIYMINRFGFVPNANRTWGTTRSQPPFLSEMVKDVYDKTKDKEWLSVCYAALLREYNFWQTKRMSECGLNRYSGTYPDLEFLCGRFCARLGVEHPEDQQTRNAYAEAFHSGCESGWDFSSRCGIKQHQYAWVCLNSLLYGFEKNMEYFSNEILLENAGIWEERAEKRKALINEFMWNDERGAFFDYDFVERKNSTVLSLATIYPLFCGLATDKQAERIVKAIEKLELKYGMSSTEYTEDLMNLQWDHPHVWPPLQMLTIKSLLRYGYQDKAKEIANKYLDVANLNFKIHGRLWEKYNGIDGEISVTKEYKTPPLMGWSSATYLYCDIIANK